ncbi:hypothetical protein DYB34_004913 [Aphanomyces astaci]|uniref:Beta-mannosidase-like galactose-binding domain-containing protein n=1 Tax=Aphanomyces astaci TaxID=112090 RepID=A0A3R7AHW6_APHAT|nr:hypothetical protein DYB34_004913 [Aphanomyces astaci]
MKWWAGLGVGVVCGAHVLPLQRWRFFNVPDPMLLNHPHVDIMTTIPGTAHTHLRDARVIPDPVAGYNERRLQWVAMATWVYETSFTLTSSHADATLALDEVDGVASILVNDVVVATTANSFVSYSVNVSSVVRRGNNTVQVRFEPLLNYTRDQVRTPTLWWPNGYGHPHLYAINMSLISTARGKIPRVVYTRLGRVGIRHLQLRQDDSLRSPSNRDAGASFYFQINRQPIVAQGANYVPLDAFYLPPVTAMAKRRHLLESARSAHMNMVVQSPPD